MPMPAFLANGDKAKPFREAKACLPYARNKKQCLCKSGFFEKWLLLCRSTDYTIITYMKSHVIDIVPGHSGKHSENVSSG